MWRVLPHYRCIYIIYSVSLFLNLYLFYFLLHSMFFIFSVFFYLSFFFLFCFLFFFFFSSRRRHTRSLRDWISDVCSSDLVAGKLTIRGTTRPVTAPVAVSVDGSTLKATGKFSFKQTDFGIKPISVGGVVKVKDELTIKIGRASCRERDDIERNVVMSTVPS